MVKSSLTTKASDKLDKEVSKELNVPDPVDSAKALAKNTVGQNESKSNRR